MGLSKEELKSLSSLAKSSPNQPLQPRQPKSGIRKFGEKTLGGALKVIDVIEKPYHAMMNIGVDAFGGEKGFSPIDAARRGFSGKEKSGFGDVLTEAGWKPDTMVGKIAKAGVSFVGSVALDPVTYLTFGTGKGLQLGGKVMTKQASNVFFKRLSKEVGKNITKASDIKKYSKYISNEKYSKVAKEILDLGYENPDAFFNKSALKFMGKEIPGTSKLTEGMSKGVSKGLEPFLKTEIGRTAKRGGKMTERSLGSIFDPYYDIKHSKRYTMKEKDELIMKLESERALKAWREMDTMNEAKKVFGGLSKQDRAKVTFEVEKLLKVGQLEKTETVVRRAVRGVQGKTVKEDLKADFLLGSQTPFTLIEQGEYGDALLLARWIKGKAVNDFDKRIVRSTMSQIRASIGEKTFNTSRKAKMISQIKDKKIRGLVEQFEDRMEMIYKQQVEAGVRKKGKSINSGYVKRILKKVTDPEDVNTKSFQSRTKGVKSIEETEKAYKSGDAQYMFETDSAKAYAASINESNVMIMRKQISDWMVGKGFMKKAGKNPRPNTVRVNVFGKYYDATPEIAREMQKISPQLSDVGMRRFLKTYDTVQNAWKLSVTSLWPSFHARNAVSNVWLGWLGGNKSPKSYALATQLQKYGHELKAGKEAVDAVVKIGNRQFKLSELWKMGGESGVIGTGWFGGEFLKKMAISKKDLAFWTRGPRRLGTAVENNARIALFVDRLGKGDDVFSAAQHTKKFLFDYGSLTETERNIFKRVVPFYSWMRKNIPLQLEQMIQQPGKYTAMAHGQKAIEGMSPATEEKYLPNWMREEEMYVRLPGRKYFNPDLPFQDLAKLTLSDRTINEIVAPISPLIKGLFEVAANKDIFRGKPLADQNLPSSQFAKEKIKKELLNNMRFTSIYKKATDEDIDQLDKLLDVMLGLKVYKFDVAQGRANYLRRKTQERNALRKLEAEKK